MITHYEPPPGFQSPASSEFQAPASTAFLSGLGDSIMLYEPPPEFPSPTSPAGTVHPPPSKQVTPVWLCAHASSQQRTPCWHCAPTTIPALHTWPALCPMGPAIIPADGIWPGLLQSEVKGLPHLLLSDWRGITLDTVSFWHAWGTNMMKGPTGAQDIAAGTWP